MKHDEWLDGLIRFIDKSDLVEVENQKKHGKLEKVISVVINSLTH